MGLSLGYSVWLLAASLLAAAALSYWTYRRTVPSVSLGWRVALGSLRFVVLGLVLFLLMEPVVQFFSETTTPPLVAVLVDDTESMQVATSQDEASSDSARSAVAPLLRALDGFDAGRAQIYALDTTLRPLPSNALDSLPFDKQRTDLATPLEQITEQTRGDNLSAVVLASDGQYNTGETPLRIADRAPVPIHTVTVGDTTPPRDLHVRRVTTSSVAYTDVAVPVRATLQSERLDAQTVTVSLSESDSLLDQKEVRLPDGTAETPVEFTYRPSEAGVTQLTVQASSVEGEATTRNNSRSTTVRVLDRKRQVLLLGAAPSPSFASIRRALEQNANANVTTRVPRQDGSFYEGPLPDTLSAFDVIVNAGFPSAPVPTEAIRSVAGTISDGTPAVFFLSAQTNLQAWSEHFDAPLPALPETASRQLQEAPTTSTAEGRQHPILDIESTPLPLIEELPPLDGPQSNWGPTPDAEVLLQRVSPTGRNGPLLVVRRRAGQRSALFLGTNPWRWATLPADLRAADALWPGLVNNLTRWTSTDADDQQVRVRPVASKFDGDESVSFSGEVYDESMSPVASAAVEVTLLDTSGAENTYTMNPSGDGQYTLDVGPLPEGTYEYRAVGRQSGSILGRDQGQLSVGALNLEYQTPYADPVLMRQIAVRSGGTALSATSAADIPRLLENADTFRPDTNVDTTERDVWRFWPFLLLLIGLLAAEWTLRKRLGLS